MNKNKQIFTKIYKTNRWASIESFSGPGSEIKATQELINYINLVIYKYEITKIVDAPCGDFNWMQKINFHQIDKYIGIDIVTDIIKTNNRNFASDVCSFIVADLTRMNIPHADLIISKDFMLHVSHIDNYNFIKRILKSGSTYFLASNYPETTLNENTDNGHWRPLNLCASPYNFPKPLESMNIYTDAVKQYPGNHMCLWRISDIKAIEMNFG